MLSVVRPKTINILGRTLKIEKTCGRIADMDFSEVIIEENVVCVYFIHNYE